MGEICLGGRRELTQRLTWEGGFALGICLALGRFALGLVEILALGIETAQVFFSHFWSLQYPLERARERGWVGRLSGQKGLGDCNIL